MGFGDLRRKALDHLVMATLSTFLTLLNMNQCGFVSRVVNLVVNLLC